MPGQATHGEAASTATGFAHQSTPHTLTRRVDSAVQRRIGRYRDSRLIARQVAILDPEQLPEMILAVCLVTLERESTRHHRAFRRRLLAAEEVQQVYAVSGDWDVVAIIATSGMAQHTEVTHD